QVVALLLPISVLLMSLPGSHLNPVATRLLKMLSTTAGSPLQLALVGLGLFYALVRLRGLRFGEIGLVACVALASLVDRHTVDLATLTALQPLPLAVVAIFELPLGLWRHSSWRVIVGSAAAVLATSASAW